MSCMWKEDEDGIWFTSCNGAFEFIDGTPKHNSFSYCPYCGETLIQSRYEPKDVYGAE
jgi:hypothetical protein